MSSSTEPPESAGKLFQPITHNTASRTLTRTHTNGSRVRRPSTAGSAYHQNGTHNSRKETRRHPDLDVNLPYRTMTNEANLEEYTKENATGEIDAGVSAPGGKGNYRLVTFLPNDPENPKNWSKAYKWYITMVVAVTCFVVAFASSVVTADIIGVQKEFDVSEEVALLSITLFVVGFGIGPMVFAPLSEVVGRRMIYATTLFAATIFIIPCAVADNITTLLVCRAIDGIAFSAPITIIGGTLADL
ncbi:uncharacterized protein RAG0_14765 [Rhynchosporium agropyri]|uniref:Major facilitator superfamily (MFS) profile domain-containing protein n=1 Tax=Rhynchosporium agropyri TaxID=914238 RepID=A0A1E1LIA0_9HELO|nr:uncharacterized protein RAG0_14765 [Rhynchosporium agropyri]